MPTLYEKSLKCAINDIAAAPNRDQANIRFKKWEVFHTNFKFKRAVKDKQLKLKSKASKLR